MKISFFFALTVTVAALFSSVFPLYAYAQSDVRASLVDCFEYYRFGSVQVPITPQTSSVVSGTPVDFSGTIANDNPYPIVDGTLYVKIFRLRDSTEKNVNGPFVVDQFKVREGITIPSHGVLPVSFSWSVPANAVSGTYQVATFFTTADKFNLLGLTFTDDVVGNRADFQVVGEMAHVVDFDKDSVTVADQKYFFAAYPPRHDDASRVPIGVGIRNRTNVDASATIEWKVYAWDSGRVENLVEESREVLAVPARGKAVAGHVVKDTQHPVYLVVGTLTWKDTKSVIGVRFVREGIDRPRLNFPSIMKYPIAAGEENEYFSCMHNVGESDAENGTLELQLTDKWGRVIHEAVYKGGISSSMMAAAMSFTPDRSYETFTLSARLYQNSVLMDEADVTYSCEDLTPGSCSTNWLTALFGWLSGMFGPTGAAVIHVAAVLLIVGMLWMIMHKTKREADVVHIP